MRISHPINNSPMKDDEEFDIVGTFHDSNDGFNVKIRGSLTDYCPHAIANAKVASSQPDGCVAVYLGGLKRIKTTEG